MNQTGVSIWTVSALTDQLRRQIEQAYPFLWVKGEIANFSKSAAGHAYFTLKEQNAQLQCVWFRGQQPDARQGGQFDPLTGEVYETAQPCFQLANGLEVLCAGQLSVYAGRGQYQLVVELVQPTGDGLYAQLLEQRRQKLAAAGYFAVERKKRLPVNPVRIALLTSPQGAAIHDFLKLSTCRGGHSHIRLYPIPVQGNEASAAISQAIALVNEQAWAEVIVLVRGGGSREDLRAFDEEDLATAIFESRIPVLAGIGHEIDTSLADMTADMRAATPSHAAELLWQSKRELIQQIDDMESRMSQKIGRLLFAAEQRLAHAQQALEWLSPMSRIERMESRCTALVQRLVVATGQMLANKKFALEFAEQKLSACGQMVYERRQNSLEKLEIALRSLDPRAPLKRGYALVRDDAGKIVRSIGQVCKGGRMNVLFDDGTLGVSVEEIHPDIKA